MAEIFKTLSNAIIVNRAVLASLKGSDMEIALTAIYGDATKTVRIVDNMSTFSNDNALIEAINTNSPDLSIIAEMRGISFDESDLFVIGKMMEIRSRVRDELLANKPSAIEAWKFADVPEGWDIEEHVIFNKTTLKRQRGDYSIGYKTLEKVWNTAAKYWGGARNDRIEVQAGGHYRTAVVFRKGESGNGERVEIGCQTIKRFELEQVALKLGWAFPEVK